METVVITGTTPTSATTKSFESAGFGTPQAAIVFISRANTTNNPEAGSGIGIGFTDGTRENFATINAQDAQATTDTYRGLNTTALAVLLGDTVGSTLVSGAFDSWATNGITIDFTTVDSVAYDISVMLIKGATNVRADTAQITATGVNDITTVGFKGNLLLTGCTGMNTLNSNSAHAIFAFGAAHNDSSNVVTQGTTFFSSPDNKAANDIFTVTRDDSCTGQMHDGVQNWKGSAETFDTSGFSINTGSDSPGNDYISYLIIDTGDPDGVDVSIVDSPTATGTWDVTAPGFTPQSTLMGLTSTVTTNTIKNTDPISFALSMFDATNEACMGIDGDDGNTVSDMQSNFSSANGVQTYEYSGGHVKMHEGSFTSFDSLGYNFNFPTDVDATARKWLSVAIKSTVVSGATGKSNPLHGPLGGPLVGAIG